MLANIVGWKIHRGPQGEGCPYNTRYSTWIKIFIEISNTDKVFNTNHAYVYNCMVAKKLTVHMASIHAINIAHFFATIQLHTYTSALQLPSWLVGWLVS